MALGRTVRLIVTSDHDDELHAHGFEVEKELKAGQLLTMDLAATEAGTYEIETHHPPLTLMRIVVRCHCRGSTVCQRLLGQGLGARGRALPL
ncbi:hypothetical protein [Pedococcus sp. 5OH_020]|uniref:hypothetical protein n=1 Tax=Pedococcus sp. 5OH_020 TaxID=2989814 RepID=UPI0022EA0924|nr:hypothetical protein [Pedococcus sp. 5OH_020]